MSERNLICDHSGCGQSAQFFALKDITKTKVCEEHRYSIAELPAYPIEAHHFIHTLDDAEIYTSRQDLVQKGLSNLADTEETCKNNLNSAIQTIQAAEASSIMIVQRTYEEISQKVQRIFDEILTGIELRRSALGKLLQDKNFRITTAEIARTNYKPAGSVFHVVIADCTVQIAEILLSQWHFLPPVEAADVTTVGDGIVAKLEAFAKEQAERENADVALEAAKFAQMLGAEGLPDYSQAARRLQENRDQRLVCLLLNTASEEELQAVARGYAQQASEDIDIGEYEKAQTEIRECTDILRARKLENAEVCLQEGAILAHYGQWSNAEKTFIRGFALNPSAEVGLQMCTALAQTYCQTCRWTEGIKACEWGLHAWSNSPHVYEVVRLVHCLLTSHLQQDQGVMVEFLVSMWIGKLQAESPRTKSILLCIQADLHRHRSNREEALRLYEESLESPQFDCYVIACCRYELGKLYEATHRSDLAKEQYLEASKICSVHFPYSFDYAQCLYDLGFLYDSLKQSVEAIDTLTKACIIYSSHVPAVNNANSFTKLGLLYNSINYNKEAEECFLKACEIYSNYFRESKYFPSCLFCLGNLYFSEKRWQEARENFEAARQIYLEKDAQSDVEDCDENLRKIPLSQ